jgi:predicted RNase H-like nuclease (RuvC/YqgF family)
MKEAFGLFGLAAVLFGVLILAPFAVTATAEGYANAPVKEKVEETQNLKEKVMKLTTELDTFKEMLKNPSLDASTKDKIAKEITDRQTEIATLTNQPTPSELKQGFTDLEEEEEGFQAVVSADLEKKSNATNLLQKATQSPL